MKCLPKASLSHRLLFAALFAGLALFTTASRSSAQSITDSWTNSFDSSSSVSSWNYWYDLTAPPYGSPIMSWTNGFNNPPSNTNSGSLVFVSAWPGTGVGVGGHGQNQVYGTFSSGQYDLSQQLDATKYDTVSFDVWTDPNSPTNSQGNVCQLNVGYFAGYGIHGATNINIPTNSFGAWYHVVALMNIADSPTNTSGIGFNINCYGGGNPNAALEAQTNPTIMYIDNLVVHLKNVPTPPPTLASTLPKAIPGLNLVASSGGVYDRQSIANRDATHTINGTAASDLTFALTITNYPAASSNAWQTHMFLVDGVPPVGEGSPDWNEPHVVFLDIEKSVTANGDVTATFRYKTNDPSTNDMIYLANGSPNTPWTLTPPTRPSITCTTALGTWSLSFSNLTNVTITCPCGSTNFVWDADSANLFGSSGAMTAYFGVQANDNNGFNGLGLSEVISDIKATSGGSVLWEDDFTAPLDTVNTWAVVASQGAINVVPTNGLFYVEWNVPDAHFDLQVDNVINGGSNSWTYLTGPNALNPLQFPLFQRYGKRWATISSADIPGTNQNFFRLIQDQ